MDLKEFYSGSREAYDKSIGAHAAFSKLRRLFLKHDIFDLDMNSPYPISTSAINKSGYAERRIIENNILKTISQHSKNRITILMGPEGSGKSTALHYS